MENLETFKTPPKVLAKMQIAHLGKILFNLQFIALAVMLASVLTFILPAIYYLMLICITLLTLFMVFSNPNFASFWKGGEHLTTIADVMTQSWKYTVPIVAVLAIASVICLLVDKNNNHIPRIITSVIIAILAIAVLVLKLINTGTVEL